MGILDKYKGKVGGAEVFGRSKFFPVGRHEVTIQRCKRNQGVKGTYYIVECTVRGSDSADLKAGDTVAQVIKMDDTYGYGLRDLKRFVCELNGIDAAEETDSVFDALRETCPDVAKQEDPVCAFAEMLADMNEDGKNPLGIEAVVSAWAHTTSKDKKITRIRWEAA